MLRALRSWHADRDLARRRLAALRDQFEAGLLAAGLGVVVHGAAAARLPHVSSVAFPGLDRQALLVALDLAGIACSAGAACASGSPEPSPALQAMGLPSDLVRATLRFSVGRENTPAEIDDAVARIAAVCRRMGPRSAGAPH
jgi:cysteine desulfurase